MCERRNLLCKRFPLLGARDTLLEPLSRQPLGPTGEERGAGVSLIQGKMDVNWSLLSDTSARAFEHVSVCRTILPPFWLHFSVPITLFYGFVLYGYKNKIDLCSRISRIENMVQFTFLVNDPRVLRCTIRWVAEVCVGFDHMLIGILSLSLVKPTVYYGVLRCITVCYVKFKIRWTHSQKKITYVNQKDWKRAQLCTLMNIVEKFSHVHALCALPLNIITVNVYSNMCTLNIAVFYMFCL